MNRFRLYLLKRNILKQLKRKTIVLPNPWLMKANDMPLIAGWIKEESERSNG